MPLARWFDERLLLRLHPRQRNQPRLHCSGVTRDLKARPVEHNRGNCPHMAKYRPWKIETAIAFRSETKARRFERYLKTGSGREFARRHF
jgi:predicted GIY-YIG superfamily endonuclease